MFHRQALESRTSRPDLLHVLSQFLGRALRDIAGCGLEVLVTGQPLRLDRIMGLTIGLRDETVA